MKKRFSLCILALALLTGACSDALTQVGDEIGNATEDARSGITGTVLLGPMTPVQSSADLSEGYVPYQTEVRVYTMDGEMVTSVETNEEGAFEVAVPAGEYMVICGPRQEGALEHEQFPRADPVHVVVVEGSVAQATILLDTGIR